MQLLHLQTIRCRPCQTCAVCLTSSLALLVTPLLQVAALSRSCSRAPTSTESKLSRPRSSWNFEEGETCSGTVADAGYMNAG